MAPLTKALLLTAFALSATALSAQHGSRGHIHHDLAARIAAPAPIAGAEHVAIEREFNKRCSPRVPPRLSPAATSAPAVNVGSGPTGLLPTTTQQPPSKTSSSAEETSSSGSGSGSGDCSEESYLCGTQTGQGTYYATGLGSCGITNADTDYICAVSHLLYDTYPDYDGTNPNNNPVCGKKITATYEGKQVTVTVTDRCAACNLTSLDFSPSAFENLADLGVGRLFGMTWVWDV